MDQNEIIWTDKKRPLFGLPLSFTRYTLTKEKLIITVKFLSVHEEEIRLYRIMDVTLYQNLFQRMFGVGTIHCCSADTSTPEFDIVSVKIPRKVKDILSDAVENERRQKKIASTEFMDLNN